MTEEKMKELFDHVRAWDPVDPKVIDRVARRLESNERNRRWWLLPLAASVAAALLAFSISREERIELEPAPRITKARPMVYGEAPRENRSVIPSRPQRPPAKPIIREEEKTVADAPIEEEPELVETPPAPSLPVRPKGYVPRAIVEFQQIDWHRLEQSDELPAYVQSIIAQRDPRALLAALDHLPVKEELRLVRGELRAQDARCAEAITDFDAILGDDHLRALHVRAAHARELCR